MCVSKITNPSNLHRICLCDGEEKYLDYAVACKMQSDASAPMFGTSVPRTVFHNFSKKDCRQIIGGLQKQISEQYFFLKKTTLNKV